MRRAKNDNSANERSVDDSRKRVRWPRPVTSLLRAWGNGCSSGNSARSDTAMEAPVDEVRLHWGALLEVLLDQKAKNLGSMIDEMQQIRVPSLRSITTPPASDIVHRTQNLSTTSSGGSMGSVQRTLERNESSLLDSREDSNMLLRGCRSAPRSLLTPRTTSVSQARRVQSETNEDLPQPLAQPRPLELQLPMGSMATTSMMGSHLIDGSMMSGFPQNAAYPSGPWISYNELSLRHELGRGQFACVKLATWKGIKVAVKEWHTMTDADSSCMAQQEGHTLSCLRHPCVVAFYGLLTSGPSPGLVVEYLQHLSLKSKLQELKNTELDTKKLKVGVALRAARGMEFLHSRKVIHFDLKCDNMLCDLRDPDDPIVKISDMGLSKEKLHTFVSGNMRGTLPWMAPELFPNAEALGSQGNVTDKVTEKVDVYSFGVVLWEIWEMGEMPYPALDPTQLLEGILNSSLVLDCPEGCDPIWARVMYDCLAKEPENRPDFSAIIQQLEQLCSDDDMMQD